MTAASPFGKYAAIVAAASALAILGAWLGSVIGFAGMVASPQLDAVALVVVGVIFGAAGGAMTVANGLGRQLAAANTRLDAVHAPSASRAAEMLDAEHGVRSPGPDA